MKLLQDTDDVTNSRKLVKSQVEKRRRERMNRSLERLRGMLLQEPPQIGAKHRVEKAEILERAVLFLQNTSENQNQNQARPGGRKQPFHDGFSTCLRRASQFLGPEGKGLWLGPALDATFSVRFAVPEPDPPGARSRTPVSLQYTKSLLRMLRQKSRLQTRVVGLSAVPHPHQLPVLQSFARVPQPQSRPGTGPERPPVKEGSPQSCLLSQTLWRPWP